MDLIESLVKEASIWKGFRKGVSRLGRSIFGRKVPARTLRRGLIGAAAGGVGAGVLGSIAIAKMLQTPQKAAKVLVEYVIKMNRAKYSRVTPEEKRRAINALVKEFTSDIKLGREAKEVASKL